MTRAGTWAGSLLDTPTTNLPRPSSGENMSLSTVSCSLFFNAVLLYAILPLSLPTTERRLPLQIPQQAIRMGQPLLQAGQDVHPLL